MMQNYRGQVLNIFFLSNKFFKNFLIKLYIYVEHTYLYIFIIHKYHCDSEVHIHSVVTIWFLMKNGL